MVNVEEIFVFLQQNAAFLLFFLSLLFYGTSLRHDYGGSDGVPRSGDIFLFL